MLVPPHPDAFARRRGTHANVATCPVERFGCRRSRAEVLAPVRSRPMSTSNRDDVRHNFALERGLANQLRLATPQERRALYASLYDEYFRNARNVAHTIDDAHAIARQVRLATRFLPKQGRYLEVGAGACRVASQVALSASRAYAVEVSAEVLSDHPGVEVIISDGVAIPVDEGSVDLVYSHQLMEHLHPDDALEQVKEIYRALAPGGAYVCITPNRLTGPHDISQHFTTVACGFHLREYTISDLRDLFLKVGFRDVRVAIALGGEVLVVVPARLYSLAESGLARLPRRARRTRLMRKFFDPGPVVAFV